MDATEKIVADHLTYRGFLSVIFEPDGNVTPDFLVDSEIAVEVRRLNQNHYDGMETKGLEEVSISLWKNVNAILANFGTPIKNESWFVHFRFSRPVEQWKTLKPKLLGSLKTFATAQDRRPRMVFQEKGFELEVVARASKVHASMFILGGCTDEQSGGWLLAEMEKNISHCAAEKSRKIVKVRSKYGQWWLALVDHIGFGLDDFDRQQFRDTVSIENDWDKIIIIDPRDHTSWFEI